MVLVCGVHAAAQTERGCGLLEILGCAFMESILDMKTKHDILKMESKLYKKEGCVKNRLEELRKEEGIRQEDAGGSLGGVQANHRFPGEWPL